MDDKYLNGLAKTKFKKAFFTDDTDGDHVDENIAKNRTGKFKEMSFTSTKSYLYIRRNKGIGFLSFFSNKWKRCLHKKNDLEYLKINCI